MNTPPTARDLHREAMEIMDEVDELHRAGSPYFELVAKAYQLESWAAELSKGELLKRILWASASSIWSMCIDAAKEAGKEWPPQ